MKRIPLVLGGASVLVLLALLLGQGVRAVRSETEARQTMVAERVFDELERSLQARLDVEEQRPFLHYNRQFAADNDLGVLVPKRSPLAEVPDDPALVGYFQRSPRGALLNPYRDAAGRSTLQPGQVEAIEAETREALLQREGSGPAEVQQQQASSPPILQALNKGLQGKTRNPVSQQANLAQVGNFLDLGDFAAEEDPDPRATSVEVEPFRVEESGRWLVFERTARVDGEPWSQGFVLRRQPFLDELQAQALGELPGALLAWDGSGALSHQFAPPFQGIEASLTLSDLPDLPSTRLLWLLTALLLAALGGIAVLVRRWLDESARLAQQRTDFVAAVTHELRTPLTSIRMYAEMLEAGMAPPTAQKDYLATIRTEAERLGTLVESVLTFAELERGTRSPSNQGPLGAVVDEVVRVLQPIATARGAQITVDLGELGSTQVPREALAQVLHNLLDNALKFAGEPHQVTLRAHRDALLRLTVHNSGPRVPEALLRRMFQPFVRGENELTRRTRGTGIGLAVVQGLVQDLGGTVTARNAPGGLEITVELPA